MSWPGAFLLIFPRGIFGGLAAKVLYCVHDGVPSDLFMMASVKSSLGLEVVCELLMVSLVLDENRLWFRKEGCEPRFESRSIELSRLIVFTLPWLAKVFLSWAKRLGSVTY